MKCNMLSWRIIYRNKHLFLALCLPLVLCQCLGTKSKTQTPGFRGLSGAESSRLAEIYGPGLKEPKSDQVDRDLNLEELASQGDLFLQSRQYESSLINYYKILAQEPLRHDIRYKVGVILLLTGKLAEAEKELAEVLAYQTDLVEAHEALGLVFLQEDKLSEAQHEFRTALALEPRRPLARYFSGVAYLRADNYSQALSEFKQAQASSPNSARIMSDLGWTYFKLKNYDQGLQWLTKAKNLNPNDPKLNRRLGEVYATLNRFPEALAAYRQAGDEAQAYNNIGVHYFVAQRYRKAARCFQKALEMRSTFYQEAKLNLEKALQKLQEEQAGQETVPQSNHQGHNGAQLSRSLPTTPGEDE
ncbi:tetratricopeptide repeat protein [Desulfobacca acetoxidans]